MENQPTQTPNVQNTKGIPTFDELHNRMLPVYTELEAVRSELVKKCKKKAAIWTAILFVIVGGLSAAFGAGIWLAVILAAVAAVITFSIVTSSPAKEYRVQYKDKLIGGFVGHMLEEGEYDPADGISESMFCNCGLFGTRPDRYHSEDLIKGRIGQTPLFFSEVHAEEKYYTTDSKGRREERWRDIFKGIIFAADFNKNFKGHTHLQRHQMIRLGGSKSRVRLEDPVFEKVFDVFATDQIEARYILTPSLMSRLTELDKKFKGKSITLSFLDRNVFIAVKDSVNYFESSLWRRADDPTILRREYDLISSLATIVDDMNLNIRIWEKA